MGRLNLETLLKKDALAESATPTTRSVALKHAAPHDGTKDSCLARLMKNGGALSSSKSKHNSEMAEQI